MLKASLIKWLKLTSLISSLKPKIIAITETWYDDAEIHLQNYVVIEVTIPKTSLM